MDVVAAVSSFALSVIFLCYLLLLLTATFYFHFSFLLRYPSVGSAFPVSLCYPVGVNLSITDNFQDLLPYSDKDSFHVHVWDQTHTLHFDR